MPGRRDKQARARGLFTPTAGPYHHHHPGYHAQYFLQVRNCILLVSDKVDSIELGLLPHLVRLCVQVGRMNEKLAPLAPVSIPHSQMTHKCALELFQDPASMKLAHLLAAKNQVTICDCQRFALETCQNLRQQFTFVYRLVVVQY